MLEPSIKHTPITGRLLVIISRKADPDLRLQVGWANSPPVFGIDVQQLRPGEVALVDGNVMGYPLRNLEQIPPGDYYVQALLNVYTEFHRADGHVIWAHMDQWEGQSFNVSPGNLYSKTQKMHLDAANKYSVKLVLSETIPPQREQEDTEWIKHIKIKSKLLTRFWGRPIYLGAIVLLPRDYALRPELEYPVVYQQGHFGEIPFNFSTDDVPETQEERLSRENIGLETGYQFYKTWNSSVLPRMIAVTFLHPTPFYDDSYAVNSASNGPYGDAIMTELIPYIEEHFRIIRQPYARVLTGGSTGGWISLALQLFHPDFFGGAWVLYPDPVDFRRYDLIDIYADDNAFLVSSSSLPDWLKQDWSPPERFVERADDGQPIVTVRQQSQMEAVLGSRGRSAGILDNWQAVYGPVGDDGYPRPLWDTTTGKIDHEVATYMRDRGYDLRHYAQTNWARIGPKLVGKLHFYCGDMDNFYLNLSVYLLEAFLESTRNPYYAGSFEYGRPMKGHGWRSKSNAELTRVMAQHIVDESPAGASLAWARDSGIARTLADGGRVPR